MGRWVVVLGLAAMVAAAGVGAYAALRPTEAEQYERLRHAQAMHALAEARQEALLPFEVAAGGLGLLALVSLLAGAVYYGVAMLRTRTQLVYPNRHGIFPLVRLRIGDQVVMHDPNRQPTPTTVYGPDGQGGVSVRPVVLPELLEAMRAAVAQAQAVQAIRAGVSGEAGAAPEAVQRATQGVWAASASALPAVHIIGDDAAIPQLEQLLGEESGSQVVE